MTCSEVLDSNKSNTCKKCGKEIMDGDTYCYSCGHKHNAFTLLVIILSYIIMAIILLICALSGIEVLFGIACVGIISPALLVPIISSKKMWFRPIKRKIYQSYPFTLNELEKKLRNDEKVISDYQRSNLGKEDHVKNHFFFFKEYVKKNIFRKLPNAKSNLISDYPGYYEFVHGVAQPQTPSNHDIQFPKYTEEQDKEDERDKLLKRISDLYQENEELKKRKPKKALVAVIVVLSVLLASVSGFAVYQQTQIQKISDKLDWKIKNYESSIASLNEKNDELRNNWHDACDELMLYHNNVAITVGQGIYYHKASCDIVQSALNTGINCKINNKVALKSQGYKPCPDCYPLDK